MKNYPLENLIELGMMHQSVIDRCKELEDFEDVFEYQGYYESDYSWDYFYSAHENINTPIELIDYVLFYIKMILKISKEIKLDKHDDLKVMRKSLDEVVILYKAKRKKWEEIIKRDDETKI